MLLVLSVTALTACAPQGDTKTEYPYYSFTLDSTGKGLILDVSNKSLLPSGELTLPRESYFYSSKAGEAKTEHAEALPVVGVADGAFKQMGAITSVVIPNSYFTIGEYAFADCKNLKTVTLSPNVEVLSKHVFDGCNALVSVLDDTSDTYIAGIKKIDDYAFASCLALRELTFSYDKSGYSIGERAFYYTISLREFDTNKTLEDETKVSASSVGSKAFEGWQATQEVKYSSDSGWADDWDSASNAKFTKK